MGPLLYSTCDPSLRSPVVCGVSSLGMDHIAILGDTIDQIAWNKAGIFKVSSRLVILVYCNIWHDFCEICLLNNDSQYVFQDQMISFNSFWPIDTTWHHRTWSTLVQVMACCLMAPSHYPNQCWFIISEILWYFLKAISLEIFKISILDMSKNSNWRLWHAWVLQNSWTCKRLQRCQPLLILLNHYSFWCRKSPYLLNISKGNQEN